MSWWDINWKYRQKLTFVQDAGQAAALADFPVLVKLTTSNFDFANALAAGADVRFVDADDITALKYEIEKWVAATEAWIWVKVPSVAAAGTTDFVYMYWGNPAAVDAQDKVNVWDANFVAVWHLNGTIDAELDSTINANNGTVTGALRGQAGQIDNAFSFDGVDDIVDVAYSASYDVLTALTAEFWVNPNTNEYELIVGRDHLTTARLWKIDHNLNFFHTVIWESGTAVTVDTAANYPNASWYHCVLTFENAGRRKFYVNGSLILDTAVTGNLPQSTAIGLRLGSRLDALAEIYTGLIDECRLSKVARSDIWIKAQFLSMTYAFLTFGAVELLPRAEVGSGVESLGSRLFGAAETGSGVEALLQTAFLAKADTGSGIEALTQTVLLVKADIGGGVESLGDRIFGAAESGAGADLSSLLAKLLQTDVGSGLDALIELIQILVRADSGAGVDALTALLATLVQTDSGVGLETLEGRGLQSPDDGTGIDLSTLLARATVDSGTGIDLSSLLTLLTPLDTGTGAEASLLLAELIKADTGSGLDAIISRWLTAYDSSIGTDEKIALLAALITSDTGAGLDIATLVKIGVILRLLIYLRTHQDMKVFTRPHQDVKLSIGGMK